MLRALSFACALLLVWPAQARPHLAAYVEALSICSPLAQPTARNCTAVRQWLGPGPEVWPAPSQRSPDPVEAAFAEPWASLLEAWRAGNTALARSRLEAMRRTYPNRAVLLHFRAHIRRAQGDLAGAVADLEAAQRQGGGNVEVLADLCSLRFRMGDRAAATRECLATLPATAARTGWYVRSVRAGVLLATGDQAAAETDIDAILRESPSHPLGLRLRAWLRGQQGEAAGAAQDLRAAQLSRPDVETELRELLGSAPPSPGQLPSPSPRI